VIVAITVVIRSLNDGSTAEDTEAQRVKVIMDEQMESGAMFRVSYELRNPADADTVVPPLALELRRDGKAINSLLALEAGGTPVRPPDAGLPLLGTTGRKGPFDFTLPDLKAGRYQLCGTVSFGGAPQERQEDSFCRTVQVTG